MGTGILLPSLFSIASSTSSSILLSNANSPGTVSVQGGPWTPPQYAKPALTVITVPATTTAGPVNYVFDAVFRLMHRRSVHKTQHPVLTGANISDHFFVEPARLVLEIGMSDVMSSYKSDMWVGASTKSISAWQILKGLALNGTLVTVTTRLDTYINMQVLDIGSPDDNKTLHGLRATITLEELLSASVSSVSTSSSRSQTTSDSSNSVVSGTGVNPSQEAQNVIPSDQYPDVVTYPQISGAGDVSSNNLGQVSPIIPSFPQ